MMAPGTVAGCGSMVRMIRVGFIGDLEHQLRHRVALERQLAAVSIW